MPNNKIAAMINVVVMGRRINNCVFMGQLLAPGYWFLAKPGLDMSLLPKENLTLIFNYPITRVESHAQPVENKRGVIFTKFRGPKALTDRVESHAQPVENKRGVIFTKFRGPKALTDNLRIYQIPQASAAWRSSST